MGEVADLSKKIEGKEVLVTGGCGFIGSYLAKKLLELGARVTVFDAKFTELGPEIQTIQGDITNFADVNDAMRNKDMVFHLAGLVGVERIEGMPLEVLEVNLGGTINALKSAHQNKVDRFIFSSSSEVYGEPRKVPIAEDDPTAPISIYGVSKLAAEAYCQAYLVKHGLKTTRVRYFNVFGPRQTERFVIPIFVSRVAANKPPIVYGGGKQIRCYSYIDNIVWGTILAATSEKGIGEVFNLGNDEPITIEDLAHLIIRLFANDLKPEFRDFGDSIRLESRDIMMRIPHISKAKRLLSYEPKINLEEGLTRYIEWYQEFKPSID